MNIILKNTPWTVRPKPKVDSVKQESVEDVRPPYWIPGAGLLPASFFLPMLA